MIFLAFGFEAELGGVRGQLAEPRLFPKHFLFSLSFSIWALTCTVTKRGTCGCTVCVRLCMNVHAALKTGHPSALVLQCTYVVMYAECKSRKDVPDI